MALTYYMLTKKLKSLESVINKELAKICERVLANKLTLNLKKTNCHFSTLSENDLLSSKL